MKPNDEVIYTLSITGIKTLADQNAIVMALPHHIGAPMMKIVPVTETTPGRIDVPRLFTRWRGDAEEQAWKSRLIEDVNAHGAACTIGAAP